MDKKEIFGKFAAINRLKKMEHKFRLAEKYNVWDGKALSCGMPRAFYTDMIMPYIDNGQVKILTGQRRVGKTYIIRQLIKLLLERGVNPSNIFYISKKFVEVALIEHAKQLEEVFQIYLQRIKPTSKPYLFFDEIENIADWEEFIDRHSNSSSTPCEIIFGSTNKRLMKSEIVMKREDRFFEFCIFPYGYPEYLSLNEDEEPCRESYRRYLHFGGLPELYHLPNQDLQIHYVSVLRDSILLRDIIQRKQPETSKSGGVRDARLLDDIFVYIVGNTASTITPQDLVRYFRTRDRKVAYETAVNYIQYLQETYLVHPVYQYNLKEKKISDAPCKLYLNDLVFRNHLFPNVLCTTGNLLENAIYLTLTRNGFVVYKGTMRGKDVDFIARKGRRTLAIQSSYSIEDPSIQKIEYAPLLNLPEEYEKFVVTMDETSFPTENGIYHVHAWELDSLM